MGRYDELIARLSQVSPTRRAERLYEDAVDSGIFIDHARALYGSAPDEHLAVEFGREVSPSDVEALRGLIYQRTQKALADKPEVMRLYRGDARPRLLGDVLAFSESPHVANRFAGPIGVQPAGEVTQYDMPRAAVLAISRLAPGTFAEAEAIARLADGVPLMRQPYRPPAFP